MAAIATELTDVRHIRRHGHLVRRNEATDRLLRIVEGWACQYRLLPDGRRQIISLFLPGDYCEAQWLLTGRANWPIVALTDLSFSEIPLAQIRADLAQGAPGMADVLNAIARTLKNHETWIVNLGRMSATERICALLLDLFERLGPTGKVVANRCPMPLTQHDIADVVGISAVHANRVLQMLRSAGVIALETGRLELLDPAELRRMCGAACL